MFVDLFFTLLLLYSWFVELFSFCLYLCWFVMDVIIAWFCFGFGGL